jgi:hypothetical protein
MESKKKGLAERVRRSIFAMAGELYPTLKGEDLLNQIRGDVVVNNLGETLSLSALTVARQIDLANLYHRRLGRTGRAFNTPSNYRPHPRRDQHPNALPTPDQRALIERLFDEVGFPPGDARSRFCEARCGRRIPPTRSAIEKVIAPLKSMAARGWRWGQTQTPNADNGGGQ